MGIFKGLGDYLAAPCSARTQTRSRLSVCPLLPFASYCSFLHLFPLPFTSPLLTQSLFFTWLKCKDALLNKLCDF